MKRKISLTKQLRILKTVEFSVRRRPGNATKMASNHEIRSARQGVLSDDQLGLLDMAGEAPRRATEKNKALGAPGAAGSVFSRASHRPASSGAAHRRRKMLHARWARASRRPGLGRGVGVGEGLSRLLPRSRRCGDRLKMDDADSDWTARRSAAYWRTNIEMEPKGGKEGDDPKYKEVILFNTKLCHYIFPLVFIIHEAL